MKAKRKNGPAKSPAASSPATTGKNVRRRTLLRESKSNSSSPEIAVSLLPRRTTLKSNVPHQQRCNSSSSSIASSSSTRRSVSRLKVVATDGTSGSVSPPESVNSVVKYSSRRSRNAVQVKTKSPDRSSLISASPQNSYSSPPNPSLPDNLLLTGSPDPPLIISPLRNTNSLESVQISSDSSSSCTANSDNKLRINEQASEGRRTSSRQRKPSWRVNFDPSDLLEDKQPLKLNSSPSPVSKSAKTSSSPVEKSQSKKPRIEIAPLESAIGLRLSSRSTSPTVTNGTSITSVSARIIKQNQDHVGEQSTVIKKVKEIKNTEDSEHCVSTEIKLATKLDTKLNGDVLELNGLKTEERSVKKIECIDLDVNKEAQNDIDACAYKSVSTSKDDPALHECCCTEMNFPLRELQISKESAELVANGCLQDEEESHLLFELFCQAVDLVGSDKIGCYRVVPEDLILYRVSHRCPFRLLCSHHNGRLKLHQCCPICGYFCTHGPGIMLCTGNADSVRSSVGDNVKLEPKWTSHLFHKTCAIQEVSRLMRSSESDGLLSSQEQPVISLENNIELISKIVCPHCGEGGDIKEISLTLKAALPVSIPERSLATRKVSAATVRNPVCIPSPEDNILRYVEESTAYSLTKANKNAKLLLAASLIPPADSKTFLRVLLQDDLARIMTMIKNKHLVNVRFKSQGGQSALHIAVSNRNICVVHGLIVSGANPNAIDDNYITPLMLAAKLNEPTLAKYLIAAGADRFHKGPNGMNVVHISAATGNLMVLQGILEDHADFLQTVDNRGMTALMHAAKNSRTEIVNYFATFWPHETNVRAVDSDKNSSLHWAAASGAVQAVSSLIKNGAVVNARNTYGQTPLHWAVSNGRDGCVLTLLVNQADISLTDMEGKTPLDLCTEDSIEDVVTKYKDMEGAEKQNSDSVASIKRTIKQCLLQTIALRSQISSSGDTRPFRVVSMDVSGGKEPHSTIQCINTIDNADLPQNFKYITSSIFSCKSQLPPLANVAETRCCNCRSEYFDNVPLKSLSREDSNSCLELTIPSCLSKSCSCSVDGYDAKERLFAQRIDQSQRTPLPVIQECNQLCGCNARLCCNRVVQRGSKCELQIFRTKRKGWGVKTLCRIPRGAFVCTYEGEVVDSIQASSRLAKYGDSYFFDLHGGHILIDSTEFGNVARFINHSCSPNVIPLKVLIEHQDKRFAHIAFFAICDIDANAEIGFDYGCNFWDTKCKDGLYCECQTEECRYRKSVEEKVDSEDDEVFSSDYDDVNSDGSNENQGPLDQH